MPDLQGKNDRGAYRPCESVMLMADEKCFKLIDVLIWDSLKTAVARYGIEGTEQKIKELYRLMPTARDKMLEVFYATYIYRENKNKP